MPSKKKKYNARFPPARIKKIMQTDEDVGKVAAAVPVIISRALELFIDSLIEKTAQVTKGKNAKTLSTSHVKQAIHSEKTFDFLRDLVVNVPDHQAEEDGDNPTPSGSGTQERKPKVVRQRKPREEGARGPGRPRKVKVEEKKESSTEDDEATETDEEVGAKSSSGPPTMFAPPTSTVSSLAETGGDDVAQLELTSGVHSPGQMNELHSQGRMNELAMENLLQPDNQMSTPDHCQQVPQPDHCQQTPQPDHCQQTPQPDHCQQTSQIQTQLPAPSSHTTTSNQPPQFYQGNAVPNFQSENSNNLLMTAPSPQIQGSSQAQHQMQMHSQISPQLPVSSQILSQMQMPSNAPQMSSETQLTMQPLPQGQHGHMAPQAPPTMQMTSQAPPTMQMTSQAPPTMQMTSQAPPSMQMTSHAPPTMQMTSQAPPTMQMTSQAPPTMQMTSQAPPTMQMTSQAPPTMQMTSQAPPTMQMTSQAPPTMQMTSQGPTTMQMASHASSQMQMMSRVPPERDVSPQVPQTKGRMSPKVPYQQQISPHAQPQMQKPPQAPPHMQMSTKLPSSHQSSEQDPAQSRYSHQTAMPDKYSLKQKPGRPPQQSKNKPSQEHSRLRASSESTTQQRPSIIRAGRPTHSTNQPSSSSTSTRPAGNQMATNPSASQGAVPSSTAPSQQQQYEALLLAQQQQAALIAQSQSAFQGMGYPMHNMPLSPYSYMGGMPQMMPGMSFPQQQQAGTGSQTPESLAQFSQQYMLAQQAAAAAFMMPAAGFGDARQSMTQQHAYLPQGMQPGPRPAEQRGSSQKRDAPDMPLDMSVSKKSRRRGPFEHLMDLTNYQAAGQFWPVYMQALQLQSSVNQAMPPAYPDPNSPLDSVLHQATTESRSKSHWATGKSRKATSSNGGTSRSSDYTPSAAGAAADLLEIQAHVRHLIALSAQNPHPTTCVCRRCVRLTEELETAQNLYRDMESQMP